MKIAETWSHLNGLDSLLIHRAALWAEIQQTITTVNVRSCQERRTHGGWSNEASRVSPVKLASAFRRRLRAAGWCTRRFGYHVTPDGQPLRQPLPNRAVDWRQGVGLVARRASRRNCRADFVRDRVAIEVQFGKYSFVAYDQFVKHLAFYIGDQIDVGIEILPMKSLQAQMSSGVGYYEGEFYNIVRQGRGVPAVPIVLIGLAA